MINSSFVCAFYNRAKSVRQFHTFGLFGCFHSNLSLLLKINIKIKDLQEIPEASFLFEPLSIYIVYVYPYCTNYYTNSSSINNGIYWYCSTNIQCRPYTACNVYKDQCLHTFHLLGEHQEISYQQWVFLLRQNKSEPFDLKEFHEDKVFSIYILIPNFDYKVSKL